MNHSAETPRFKRLLVASLCLGVVLSLSIEGVGAQGARGGAPVPAPKPARPAEAAPAPAAVPEKAAGVTPPEDYLIGADDVLSVIFWRDKDMSADVIVRPDGKITLPLLNDLVATGLTPTQLREKIVVEAGRFLEDPAATVVVKQINSRKVFITGEVGKPGPYTLTTPISVLQLIAMAGGLSEYARREDIVIMRNEGGRQVTFPFDYSAVVKRKKLQQNILLKPGDTVIIP